LESQVSGTDSAAPLPPQEKGPAFRDGATAALSSSRLSLMAAHDPDSAALVHRLLHLAACVLSQAHVNGTFAHTLAAARMPDGSWQVRPSGMSPRYGIIAVLGLIRLPEPSQRRILGGAGCHDLVGSLARRLDDCISRADTALLCWAAAETGHGDLPRALERLRALDVTGDPIDVVSASWVVTALVAARPHADVERHLAVARARLLSACDAVYPHVIGGSGPWFRSHVGSFADQVYPVQALARLHRSADDPQALAVADAVAAAICRTQGGDGQWWWHYDSRTGNVVEGYPVYSVHQHAMAPMALLDLADAGGQRYLEAVCRGLRWLARPPETIEDLVLDEPPLTWRKVSRNDRGKVVRGLRAASTRVRPGLQLRALDRVFRAGSVDHECRPYELGWLLLAWLS
jgi:hypothetical protein